MSATLEVSMDTLKLEPKPDVPTEQSLRVEGTFRKLPTDFDGPAPLCTGKRKALRNCPGDDTNPESTRAVSHKLSEDIVSKTLVGTSKRF
ncbi:hypothetical protein PC9H_005970 [Pleurotus ostreatus]|uniref:Uncharacterized protein n=2 Tax=Pleurotus ostreatus TaxID=5322 RepID=A0A067NDI8_PLEO1|nr:uncharacterized protein PC9H_005970 [Pleurotus ostreatus]KAF7430268.1 hypothetical protein PC9H_005970 [Pleurotus ostreatus]KDQ22192.1 hypothetical protein PLEOSDRAFT_1109310 [Pleurotus ostreatus PC15]